MFVPARIPENLREACANEMQDEACMTVGNVGRTTSSPCSSFGQYAAAVHVRTHVGNQIVIHPVHQDSFGRYLLPAWLRPLVSSHLYRRLSHDSHQASISSGGFDCSGIRCISETGGHPFLSRPAEKCLRMWSSSAWCMGNSSISDPCQPGSGDDSRV